MPPLIFVDRTKMMAAAVLNSPHPLNVWAEMDDDTPRPPEAPPPRWPLPIGTPLDSAQARRAALARFELNNRG